MEGDGQAGAPLRPRQAQARPRGIPGAGEKAGDPRAVTARRAGVAARTLLEVVAVRKVKTNPRRAAWHPPRLRPESRRPPARS